MTRQTENTLEQKEAKRALKLLRALEGGLDQAIGRAGGELYGFSVKANYDDCLLVLRAGFPSGPCVAFVGGYSAAQCLVKATREAGTDNLRWRQDKFKVNGLGKEEN